MLILCYHELCHESGSPYSIPIGIFRAQIEWLLEQDFTFITLDDIAKDRLSEPEQCCAITFDDGRLGVFELGLEALADYKIKATFFICSDFMDGNPVPESERYSEFMNWDQVLELKDRGHVIGSHGRRHPSFFDLDQSALDEELRESKQTIERRLGTHCTHFASPFGHVDQRIIDTTKKFGYKTFCSAVPRINKKPYDLFDLRRFPIVSEDSLRHFKKQITDAMKDAHQFNVLLLCNQSEEKIQLPQAEQIARYDVVVCFDDISLKACQYFRMNHLDGISLAGRPPARGWLRSFRNRKLFKNIMSELVHHDSIRLEEKKVQFDLMFL